jgi:hypothetical protein
MRGMNNYAEHLFCTHRLAILTHMQTLTVYHIGDLLAAHSSV